MAALGRTKDTVTHEDKIVVPANDGRGRLILTNEDLTRKIYLAEDAEAKVGEGTPIAAGAQYLIARERANDRLFVGDVHVIHNYGSAVTIDIAIEEKDWGE